MIAIKKYIVLDDENQAIITVNTEQEAKEFTKQHNQIEGLNRFRYTEAYQKQQPEYYEIIASLEVIKTRLITEYHSFTPNDLKEFQLNLNQFEAVLEYSLIGNNMSTELDTF